MADIVSAAHLPPYDRRCLRDRSRGSRRANRIIRGAQKLWLFPFETRSQTSIKYNVLYFRQ